MCTISRTMSIWIYFFLYPVSIVMQKQKTVAQA